MSGMLKRIERLEALAQAPRGEDWGTLVPMPRPSVEEWTRWVTDTEQAKAAGVDSVDATIQAWERHVGPWQGEPFDGLRAAWRAATGTGEAILAARVVRAAE